MSDDYNYVEVEDATCKAETTKALLVEVNGVEVWVPKSLLGDDNELNEQDDTGTLVVAEWFATREGLT